MHAYEKVVTLTYKHAVQQFYVVYLCISICACGTTQTISYSPGRAIVLLSLIMPIQSANIMMHF